MGKGSRAYTPPGGTRSRRALATLLVATLSLTTLAACSQKEKRDLAEQVAESIGRDKGQVFVGHVKMTLRARRMPGGRPIPAEMSGGTLAAFGVSLDAKRGRGAYVNSELEPLVVYDRDTIYAKRVVRSKADRRLWARLELDRLRKMEVPDFDEITRGAQPGDALVIGPVLLADLLAGVLTGSVKERDTDKDGNRRITFNYSISKANRELRLDDDEREAREELLRALAITDDIGPGEVVLTKDGTLAYAKFTFAERPDKQTRLDLVAEVGVAPVSQQAVPDVVGLTTPSRDTTVRVSALGSLRATLSEQLQGPDGGRSPLGGLQAVSGATAAQQSTSSTIPADAVDDNDNDNDNNDVGDAGR